MLYGMYNRRSQFGYSLEEKPYSFATAGALPFSQGVLGISFIQRGSWFNGTQIVTHNTVALSFARFISSSITIGGNAKYLFNTNYGNEAGADIDLGLMFFATPGLTFGLATENLLSTRIEPDDLGTYFSYNRRQVKLGVAGEFSSGQNRTSLGFDLILKQKKDLAQKGNYLNNFGIEHSLPLSSKSTLRLRAGYSLGKDYNQNFNSYAFGFSYELRSGNNLYRLDYSYQDYPYESSESFVGDNRLALTVAWGSPRNIQSLAKKGKYLNPAVVAGQEKTQESSKSASESISQTKADTVESVSAPIAQQAPAENDTTYRTATQIQPEESKEVTVQVTGGTFAGLRITSQVKSSKEGTNQDRFYMFLFQYNLEEPLKSVVEWKILISSSTSDSFLTHGSDPSILQIINGQGNPPTAVGWEGDDKNGKKVAPGNYFYALYLKSSQGEKFLSAWSPIIVD
jgi:hypothetical protein